MFSVLIVDDEKRTRETLKVLGDWESCNVSEIYEAEDGLRAFSLICQLSPDILILDMNMPMLDGIQLMELLKKNSIEINVIIISGYDDYEYTHQSILYGVRDYLLKPINRAQFNAALKNTVVHMMNERKQKKINSHIGSFYHTINLSAEIFSERLLEEEQSSGKSRCFSTLTILTKMRDREMIFSYFNNTNNFKNLFDVMYIGGYNPQYYVLSSMLDINQFTVNIKNYIAYALAQKEFGNKEQILFIKGRCFEKPAELRERLNGIRSILQNIDITDLKNTLLDEEEVEAEDRYLSVEFGAKTTLSAENLLDPLTELRQKIENGEYVRTGKIRREFLWYIDTLKAWFEYHSLDVSLLHRLIYLFETALNSYDHQTIVLTLNIFMDTLSNVLLKKDKRADGIFENIRQYIVKNYYKDITLTTLSEQFYLSKAYLCRKFKEIYDMSIVDYINLLRLENSKKLLKNGVPVSVAWEQVGYSSSNYFGRLFKKQYNMTPSEYQKYSERTIR